MVMPPRYYATTEHPGIFFSMSVVDQAARYEALNRIANPSKKRQSAARFGRYLDFIAAQRAIL
jgi:hypothetical protein